jgi:hypothetical protein
LREPVDFDWPEPAELGRPRALESPRFAVSFLPRRFRCCSAATGPTTAAARAFTLASAFLPTAGPASLAAALLSLGASSTSSLLRSARLASAASTPFPGAFLIAGLPAALLLAALLLAASLLAALTALAT